MQSDCRGVPVCLISFNLEKDAGLLPAWDWDVRDQSPSLFLLCSENSRFTSFNEEFDI